MLIKLSRIFEEILHVSFMDAQVCWQGGQCFFVIQTFLSPADVTISFGGWWNQSVSWTLSAFFLIWSLSTTITWS